MLEASYEPVLEHDGQSAISATGLEWTQLHYAVVQTGAMALAIAAFGGAISAVGWLVNEQHRGPWESALFWLAAAAAITLWLINRFGLRKSALLFHADGRIEMPYGRPYRRFQKWIDGDHVHIVSIETQQSDVPANMREGGPFDVCMYAENGDTIYVAVGVQRREAHKIAVLLTNALTRLRDSKANPSRRAA